MCLHRSQKEMDAYQVAWANAGGKKRKMYKVVTRKLRGTFQSNYVYTLGENIAEGKLARRGTIHGGAFHVCLTLDKALSLLERGNRILRVTVEYKDLVAVGARNNVNYYENSNEVACFKRLTVTKSDMAWKPPKKKPARA